VALTTPRPADETSPRAEAVRPDAESHDYAPYRALLAEAQSLRGVSLWQDAWRRLKRNRVAMASLGFLIVLTSLALLTPLLPLQSPSLQDVTEEGQFQPPNFHAARLQLVDTDKQTRTLTELVARYEDDLARLAAANDMQTYEAKLAAHPYEKFWNNPDVITSRLIDLRLAIFGDWCLPSLCGTDALGRDVLSRLLWGARVSLMVGVTAALVSLVIGVSYGATAGYLGGWIDSLMMRIVDTLYAIPFLFVVIFLITILSEESRKAWLESYGINRIVIFYIVIGLFYWFTMARVVRGQVISLKNEQFVDAARTIGAGSRRIIFRHLVPNVLGVVIIYLTLTIPSVMLFEAILSYLGLGVEPPDVSWGLLADQGTRVITPIKTYWWLVLYPSLALAVTLFALNFLGDGLRDALDPRLKNRS
jgi:oligopeptide transport system permease protein